MARLVTLRTADMDMRQRELYQHIVAGPRSGSTGLTDVDGGLRGPFNAMLYAPSVGGALQQLGAAIRYATSLPDRVREIAILAVAAHWDSAFERQAHEAIGRSIGLTEDEISALRISADPPLSDPAERAALRCVRALLTGGDLDDDAYADAIENLGETVLMELSTLVGYYGMLALQLRIFRVQP